MMGYVIAAIAALAAIKAAWDQYSHEGFAWICLGIVITAVAALKYSELSRRAKLGPKQSDDDTAPGCLFWIVWKIGGVTALFLLGAVYSEYF